MKNALELSLHADGRFSRALHFDIHDNLKEIAGNTGLIGATEVGAQGELAGVGQGTGAISASDEANVSNSGNVSSVLNLVDPGTVAASERVSEAALASNADAVQAALRYFSTASNAETDLAKQSNEGQTNVLVKTLAWAAVAVAGIWLVVSFLFGKKKREATA